METSRRGWSEPKEFFPSHLSLEGENSGDGSGATHLIGFEVQECDRYPGALLLRVGGGGFWARLRAQKGPQSRRVFARADYKTIIR